MLLLPNEQEPRLALVDVQLPQEALDAQPGSVLPSGLTMRVSTAGNADVLQVHACISSMTHADCGRHLLPTIRRQYVTCAGMTVQVSVDPPARLSTAQGVHGVGVARSCG